MPLCLGSRFSDDFQLCTEYIGFSCLTMNLQLLVCAVTTWLVVTGEDASKPQLRGTASSAADGTVTKEVANQTPDIAVFSSGIEKDPSGYEHEQLQGQNATTLNNTAGLTAPAMFSELKPWGGHPQSHGGPPPGGHGGPYGPGQARRHPYGWPGHNKRPPANQPPPVHGPRR